MLGSNSGTQLTMPVAPAYAMENGGAFGGNGFSDIVGLAVLGLIFGNGNGNGIFGLGGRNNGGSYVSDNYALITDNATLERKIDGVYSGICDSTYALNNAITGGFAAAQSTMTQGFAGLNTALIQQGYESRIATQGVGNTVQNCCCDIKQQIGDVKYAIGSTGADISRGVERGFADTNYNLATQSNMLDRTISDKFCQTNFNNATNTRDIIDATNAGFMALSNKIDNYINGQKDAKIAEQACELNNQRLLSQINKTPWPCYVVANPNCNCQQNLYGTTIA